MVNTRLDRNAIVVFAIMSLILWAGIAVAKEVGELTDGRMEGAIERRLKMDSRINSDSIGVTVKDGHVRLFGSVDTLHDYGHATQVASSVIGVNSVQNTIEIRPNPGKDQSIRNTLAQRLENEELLNGDKIQIRVNHQVVTLMGTASNQTALQQAQYIAESVEGVEKVENLLNLKGSSRSDQAIRQDVLHFLLWSPLADPDDFKVSVNQGVVTLEGTVQHLIHRDVLAMDIIHIQGVKNVQVGKVIPKELKITLAD